MQPLFCFPTQADTKHFVNGLCIEEDDTDLDAKPTCVSYTPDSAPPPAVDNIVMTSQKPNSAAKGENKSKVADVRKGHVKKQLGVTKKLKGSKRQRKKNKKKKMGKKKKKS